MTRGSIFRLALLALIWGSGFLWIAVGLRGFSPVQVTFARLALGALVLVPFVLARGGRLPRGRAVWAHLTVAALVSNAIPYTLFAIAQRDVASSIAGVINATTPLWTLVFEVSAGEREIGRYRIAGLALGFVGTLIIFQPWQSGSDIASWAGLACLAAAASYGISYVYQHRYLTNRGLPPLTLAAGQLIASTVLLALVVPVAGLQAPHWRADAIVAVLILGAIGTGAAYVLNYRLIADEGPATSVVTYLLPVVAISLGVAFLNEPFTTGAVVGVSIVLAGVALTRQRGMSEQSRP
jgi:drug/metabolite transporter (DMT)-like permease